MLRLIESGSFFFAILNAFGSLAVRLTAAVTGLAVGRAV